MDQLLAFLSELNRESERGLALGGAAFIDQKLAETLGAFFCRNVEMLEGAHQPLGSFSARISLCGALGLIDNFEEHECNIIRKVRNVFAHSIAGTRFHHPKVSSLCSSLRSDYPRGSQADPAARNLFFNAVSLLSSQLLHRPKWVHLEQRREKLWVDREVHRWRTFSEGSPPPGAQILLHSTGPDGALVVTASKEDDA